MPWPLPSPMPQLSLPVLQEPTHPTPLPKPPLPKPPKPHIAYHGGRLVVRRRRHLRQHPPALESRPPRRLLRARRRSSDPRDAASLSARLSSPCPRTPSQRRRRQRARRPARQRDIPHHRRRRPIHFEPNRGHLRLRGHALVTCRAGSGRVAGFAPLRNFFPSKVKGPGFRWNRRSARAETARAKALATAELHAACSDAQNDV